MKNPWINLSKKAPYILPEDKTYLNKITWGDKDSTRIRFEAIPSPYTGNPLKAKIVFLALNPGFKEEDMQRNIGKEIIDADIKNLTFSNDMSFYILDKKFAGTGGFQWWNSRLQQLIKLLGRNVLTDSISCVQYFPYHSKIYKNLRETLPSQEYSFYLVREAIKQKKVIVIMRSKKLWFEKIPELKNYPFIELKVPRSPYFTKNNMSEYSFNLILKTLRK